MIGPAELRAIADGPDVRPDLRRALYDAARALAATRQGRAILARSHAAIERELRAAHVAARRACAERDKLAAELESVTRGRDSLRDRLRDAERSAHNDVAARLREIAADFDWPGK